MKLRDFTKTDWYGFAFAGCKSEKPMIGDVTVYYELEPWESSGFIIVDNNHIQIHLLDEKNYDNEKTFYKEYKGLTREEVIAIVNMWPKEIDKEYLDIKGFEEI